MTPKEADNFHPRCPYCTDLLAPDHRMMPPMMNQPARYLYFQWICFSDSVNGDSHQFTLRKKSDTP